MEKLISATEFKAKCLKSLEELEPQGIIITKRGQPVARLTRLQVIDSELIGSMKGKVIIEGSIFSTRRRWNAQS